jgi:hypothetical protein
MTSKRLAILSNPARLTRSLTEPRFTLPRMPSPARAACSRSRRAALLEPGRAFDGGTKWPSPGSLRALAFPPLPLSEGRFPAINPMDGFQR